MVTLAAYCLAHGLNMHTAGETELTRIWTKVDKIRAKQAAKPKGSVLPQAWPESNTPDALARLVEAMKHLHDIINCGNCSGSRQSARLALRALKGSE